MKQICVVFVLLAACLMQGSNAIKCYQCQSLTDADCAKEVYNKASNVVDCDMAAKPNTMEQYSPVTRCNKVVSKDAAGQIATRGCQFDVIGQKNDACLVNAGREVISCSICKGDLCNSNSSAARIASTGLLAILALVAIKFAL